VKCVILLPFVCFVFGCGGDPVESIVTDKLVDAIVQVESGGNRYAQSRKGAKGLMQITATAWKSVMGDVDFDKNWRNPVANRYAGVEYLLKLERTIAKNRTPTVELLCAAYNGGITRLRKCGYDVSKMPKETQCYINRVTKETKKP
jgi:soluble lytic murein transglycosylase-like protein